MKVDYLAAVMPGQRRTKTVKIKRSSATEKWGINFDHESVRPSTKPPEFYASPFSYEILTSCVCIQNHGSNLRIVVQNLAEGAPGASSGLKLGDEVVSVAGVSAVGMTAERLRALFSGELARRSLCPAHLFSWFYLQSTRRATHLKGFYNAIVAQTKKIKIVVKPAPAAPAPAAPRESPLWAAGVPNEIQATPSRQPASEIARSDHSDAIGKATVRRCVIERRADEKIGLSIIENVGADGSPNPGASIKSVVPGGAAARAGLVTGEQIAEINGVVVSQSHYDFILEQLRVSPSSNLEIAVFTSPTEDESRLSVGMPMTSTPFRPEEARNHEKTSVAIDTLPSTPVQVKERAKTRTVTISRTHGESLGLKIRSGPGTPIVIDSVLQGGAAAREGSLCSNDVICEVNGKSIAGFDHDSALRLMADSSDETITFTVIRNALPKTPVPVLNNAAPKGFSPARTISIRREKGEPIGLKILATPERPLSITGVFENSPAGRGSSLKSGDIVSHINGSPVSGLSGTDIKALFEEGPTDPSVTFFSSETKTDEPHRVVLVVRRKETIGIRLSSSDKARAVIEYIVPSSVAHKSRGIREGDVIIELNGRLMPSRDDANKILSSGKGEYILTMMHPHGMPSGKTNMVLQRQLRETSHPCVHFFPLHTGFDLFFVLSGLR